MSNAPATRRILFLLSSARADGNSAMLARTAAASLPCACEWQDLQQDPLPPFHDLRPDAPPALAGRLEDLSTAILAASDLVFVTPVYWYALPVPAKLALDHLSSWLDMPEAGYFDRLAGKRVWMITTRADPDPTVPDLPEAMLKRTTAWLGMHWAGALHGIGDAPGDILEDRIALAAAAGFLGESLSDASG